MREPVNEIRILLPVWGERYVEQFLSIGLPSLLADGNLPALRLRAPCTFAFFTRSLDAEAIRRNPLFQTLESLCSVEIELIDDLISASPSTIITIAYASGIRSAENALQTCFIFLVADYVFADGALDNVAARIFAGSSGVLVGNFQVSLEGASSVLMAQSDARRLSIKPRDLVRLAMDHLHPTTTANFADGPIRCDPTSNRLFWRLGDSAMLGRFYLMHMIAIRPETADFTIAAPSDYALIPELCPSGAVTTIGDSDEYCVIELTPVRQVASKLRFGPLEPGAFAASLRTWATERHRENARRPVVFHCNEMRAPAPEAVAESQRFVEAVERALPAAAQPFRHHPYWRRAIDHHVRTATTPVDFERLQKILGDPNLAAYRAARSVRLRAALLGHAPNVRPWHPRWPDSRRLWDSLARIADAASVLFVGELPAELREGLTLKARALGARRVNCAALREFAGAPDRVDSNELEGFDVCVLILPSSRLGDCWRIAQAYGSALSADGRILVAIGDVFQEAVRALIPEALAPPPTDLMRAWRIDDFGFTPASDARLLTQSAMMESARSSLGGGLLAALAGIARAGALAALSAAFNWRALRQTAAVRPAQCSSVFLTLRRQPTTAD
jgi:hypothetical protein